MDLLDLIVLAAVSLGVVVVANVVWAAIVREAVRRDRGCEMRRLRKVAVAGSLVADAVGLGTGSAIPAERFTGMRLVGARYDAFADTLWLLFEHPEFAEVPEGAEPPTWEPMFLQRETSTTAERANDSPGELR